MIIQSKEFPLGKYIFKSFSSYTCYPYHTKPLGINRGCEYTPLFFKMKQFGLLRMLFFALVLYYSCLYSTLTTAFFCSVEVTNNSYLLSPAVMIISEVFGGMVPRFSATITNSCTGSFSSQ